MWHLYEYSLLINLSLLPFHKCNFWVKYWVMSLFPSVFEVDHTLLASKVIFLYTDPRLQCYDLWITLLLLRHGAPSCWKWHRLSTEWVRILGWSSLRAWLNPTSDWIPLLIHECFWAEYDDKQPTNALYQGSSLVECLSSLGLPFYSMLHQWFLLLS